MAIFTIFFISGFLTIFLTEGGNVEYFVQLIIGLILGILIYDIWPYIMFIPGILLGGTYGSLVGDYLDKRNKEYEKNKIEEETKQN